MSGRNRKDFIGFSRNLLAPGGIEESRRSPLGVLLRRRAS
jgi:hypothetical protein